MKSYLERQAQMKAWYRRNAARRAAIAEERRQTGKCGHCGRPIMSPGFVTCEVCRKASRKLKTAKLAGDGLRTES